MSVKTFVNDEITKISWELNGVWVTDDGVEEGTVPFKVEGTVTDYKLEQVPDNVKVKFEFPENFLYKPVSIKNGNSSYVNGFLDVSYFGCHGKSSAQDSDHTIDFQYALDLELEYMLLYWEDHPERYLVASVNPNVKPENIVTHFKAFLNAGDPLEREHDVSWQMHGTWVTAEGESLENVEFAVEAHTVDVLSDADYDKVKFRCTFPGEFRYSIDDFESYNHSMAGFNNDRFYWCSALSYDTKKAVFVACEYALDIENKYVLIRWEGSDNVLVASVDPNIDPKEILEYFDGYLDN